MSKYSYQGSCQGKLGGVYGVLYLSRNHGRGYFRGPLLREIYIRSFVLITPGLKVKYVSFLSDDTTTGPVRTGSGKGWKVTTSL